MSDTPRTTSTWDMFREGRCGTKYVAEEMAKLERELNEAKHKARMFDYLAQLEKINLQQQADAVNMPRHTYLVLAADGTTCWGQTYQEAVENAMRHDNYE